MKQKNNKKEKARDILEVLQATYPEAKCELNHKSAFELLVATILSAQTTDKKVNEVTEGLFKYYKTPSDFLTLSQPELENKIRVIGLYRNKAKNLLEMCKMLVEKYEGAVPDDMERLVELPGVGRKTANVVLSNAFGVPALAVDTHVFRVSNRLGLAESSNVDETEKQLTECIDRDKWSHAHHLLIWHGRRICDAKKPKCEVCPVSSFCKYFGSGQIERG